MDKFDHFSVQGTPRNLLLQHQSSKASILWCSAFLTVQLSQPYIATGKTRALTIRTFVGRVMSLLFSMLSRLAIAFLSRSNRPDEIALLLSTGTDPSEETSQMALYSI
uniref:Uncharacterized protein n=1 Tax=Pseudonaja textilis TaxID=8673 RepID=A0A670YVJ8_PSETE